MSSTDQKEDPMPFTPTRSSVQPPPPPPPHSALAKQSPAILKLRTVPASLYFRKKQKKQPQDKFPAPTGPYFFYGSLLDPCMLVEILSLETEPDLRAAYIEGFQCKLWGQYPALVVDEIPGSRVEGAAYEVQSVGDADKLAAYETENYTTVSCDIVFRDGREPRRQMGSVFVFDGDSGDLSEGRFDLRVWLRRVGRLAALEKVDATKVRADDGSSSP